MNRSNLSSASSDSGSNGYATDLTTPDCSPTINPLSQNSSLSYRLAQLDAPSCLPSGTPLVETIASVIQSPDTHDIQRVCVIGAGYVGGPTAAILALHNPHVRITVVDKWETRIRRWNSAHLPIHEPGLEDVVRVARDGGRRVLSSDAPSCQHVNSTRAGITRVPNLFFSSDCETTIKEADLIMLAVNTPTKKSGLGAGRATDLSSLELAARDVATYAKPGAVLVEKSTVPVGTATMIRRLLDSQRPNNTFQILSNPEFLAEGTAIKNLMHPDRVLIGHEPTKAGFEAASALAELYTAWVPRSKILTTNVWSSELAKLVANAMLAQRISSINSISALCEASGADIREIAKAVGQDQRIGSQFLKSGLGFGGSCFRKDIASLTYISESMGLPEVAEYWRQVLVINNLQRDRLSAKIVARLNNTLVGKKIAVLGFAYKKDTGDTRESLVVEMVQSLMQEAPREIAIYDPCCSPENIRNEIKHLESATNSQRITYHTDPYEACSDAAGILVATDWDQFQNRKTETCMQVQLQAATATTLLASTKPASTPVQPSVRDLNTVTLATCSYNLNKQPSCADSCPDCISTFASSSTSASTAPRLPLTARLDWTRIAYHMSAPKYVLDGRGFLDLDGLREFGMVAEAVGRRGVGMDGLGGGFF